MWIAIFPASKSNFLTFFSAFPNSLLIAATQSQKPMLHMFYVHFWVPVYVSVNYWHITKHPKSQSFKITIMNDFFTRLWVSWGVADPGWTWLALLVLAGPIYESAARGSRLGSAGDGCAPCVSHPPPEASGFTWVCPSEGDGSSTRKKISPASPYQTSAWAISAIIPLAKAHSRAQSKEVGKYLPPTIRRVLQSHMTKGMDTGRGVEQGH